MGLYILDIWECTARFEQPAPQRPGIVRGTQLFYKRSKCYAA